MKLEEGMYVRTKDKMVKIEKISDGVMWDTQGHVHFGDFIKASHNIIDLIEVGDYVNGVRIDELSHNRFTNAKAVATNNSLRKDTGKQYWFENEDIKSMVTKEQFEQMQYKVGE